MQRGFSPSRGSGTSRLGDPPSGDRRAARDLDRARLRALGAAVRELRARRGLSQEEVGYRCDLHRNYVGGIERGELNITFRTLLKLERGLRVPLSELIGMYERNRVAALGVVAPSRAASVRGSDFTSVSGSNSGSDFASDFGSAAETGAVR